MRAAVGPDKILSIKLNSADFQRGGFTEEQSLAVIEQLDREEIDLLEVSGGTYESPAMSDGGTSESTRRREAFFLDFAERVRTVTTVPPMVTGGFRTGKGMTDAITSGATDLIGLARPLALQPELPTALLASPDTARSDFELKKIGIKKLDSAADLWWTQHQIQRLGAGKDPDPDIRSAPRRARRPAARRAQHAAPPPRRLGREHGGLPDHRRLPRPHSADPGAAAIDPQRAHRAPRRAASAHDQFRQHRHVQPRAPARGHLPAAGVGVARGGAPRLAGAAGGRTRAWGSTTASTARSPAHAPSMATIVGTAGFPPTTEPPPSPRTSQWSCSSTASYARGI